MNSPSLVTLTALIGLTAVVGCTKPAPEPAAPAATQAQAVTPAVSEPATKPTATAATPTPPAEPVKPPAAPPEPTSPDGEADRPEATPDDLEARKMAAYKAKGSKYVPRTRHKDPNGTATFVNRLIFESSPYLLQHAHNPVDWNPWGPEAFERARVEKKPVLLSVGYATCHWCHVMEEESFEDLEIAKYMTDNFVCIKVDREERPDVDNVYMTAVNMLHGRGGWPMTVAMTHNKEPFFGGTYFPPRDGVRGSRKGFLTILGELKKEYDTDPEGVVTKAQQISRRIAARSKAQPAAGVADHTALKATADAFVGMLDKVNGGFGNRPKFPRPVSLEMLLQYYRRSGDKNVLDAVTLTLDKMAAGGIHDQIGGGFHRYTVDARWLIPHFEKMLYDNGQLVCLYLNAYQITGKAEYARVVRFTLDYALREMRDPSGAFWSATDADSEGEEGLFFLWKPPELKKLLGEDLATIALKYWGVTDRGNFEGQNILNVPRPHDQVARELNLTPAQLRAKIDEASRILYPVRLKRIPPLTDDKVLTAWNGLMISALARGAFVLNEPRYAAEAAEAARFLLTTLRRDGRLLRTWKAGSGAKYIAYLEDYAFLGQGLLDLYEATNDLSWLQESIALHELALKHYQDNANGGFFRTAHDAEKLLSRNKPDYDGAEPSGNSVIARNLLRLYEYTGNTVWHQAAERTLKWASNRLKRGGRGVPAMLSALDYYLDSPRQVIIVEAENDATSLGGTGPLLDVVRKQYLPNRLLARQPESAVPALTKMVPAAAQKTALKGKTTAYVCERGVCERPTSDPKVLAKQLSRTQPYVDPAASAP